MNFGSSGHSSASVNLEAMGVGMYLDEPATPSAAFRSNADDFRRRMEQEEVYMISSPEIPPSRTPLPPLPPNPAAPAPAALAQPAAPAPAALAQPAAPAPAALAQPAAPAPAALAQPAAPAPAALAQPAAPAPAALAQPAAPAPAALAQPAAPAAPALRAALNGMRQPRSSDKTTPIGAITRPARSELRQAMYLDWPDSVRPGRAQGDHRPLIDPNHAATHGPIYTWGRGARPWLWQIVLFNQRPVWRTVYLPWGRVSPKSSRSLLIPAKHHGCVVRVPVSRDPDAPVLVWESVAVDQGQLFSEGNAFRWMAFRDLNENVDIGSIDTRIAEVRDTITDRDPMNCLPHPNTGQEALDQAGGGRIGASAASTTALAFAVIVAMSLIGR